MDTGGKQFVNWGWLRGGVPRNGVEGDVAEIGDCKSPKSLGPRVATTWE